MALKNIIIINHNVYVRYCCRSGCGETNVSTRSTLLGTHRNHSQNVTDDRSTDNTTYMTDRTRYDRTEEEAPLVPFIGTTGRDRPTTDRPTIDRQTTDRPTTDDRWTDERRTDDGPTAARTPSDRPQTEFPSELERELRTLQTQLDRIEATLQDNQ